MLGEGKIAGSEGVWNILKCKGGEVMELSYSNLES